MIERKLTNVHNYILVIIGSSRFEQQNSILYRLYYNFKNLRKLLTLTRVVIFHEGVMNVFGPCCTLVRHSH